MGFALSEIALRVVVAFHHASARNPAVDDHIFHHRWRANVHMRVAGADYVTNSFGLRGPEIAATKPPGIFRVLVLGDSFTEGYRMPFEDSVTRRLQHLVDADHCRGRFEVVNGGVATYSPILEYLLLQHIGLRLHPDLIVLNFDMSDLHDDFIRTKFARLDVEGLPVAVTPSPIVEGALVMFPWAKPRALEFFDHWETLAARSALFQALHTLTTEHDPFRRPHISPARLERLDLVGKLEYDPMTITRDEESASERAAWPMTERYLIGIHRLASEHGVPFVLVAYPYPHQVSATEAPESRSKLGLWPGLYRSERPFRILRALGQRNGFPVIDLLDFFRQRDAIDGPLFWKTDFHHTPAGALVFAEGIAAGLREHHLIPACSRDSDAPPATRSPERDHATLGGRPGTTAPETLQPIRMRRRYNATSDPIALNCQMLTGLAQTGQRFDFVRSCLPPRNRFLRVAAERRGGIR